MLKKIILKKVLCNFLASDVGPFGKPAVSNNIRWDFVLENNKNNDNNNDKKNKINFY